MFLPLVIFLFDLCGYSSMVAGAIWLDAWYLRLACGLGAGLFIGMLFTVGHDACHGSFTDRTWLNECMGRVAFLPSLMPYTCWKYTHNYLHHSYTNLAGQDFVWQPRSYEEYLAFPWWRKVLERLYRHPIGLPLNWIIDNWLFQQFLPKARNRMAMKSWEGRIVDQGLVYIFLALQIATIAGLGLHGGYTTVTANLFFALIVPFLYWSTLISFVDLFQHTHPEIPWFKDKKQWDFYQSQVRGTVHVIMPWPIRILFHNIMEHTAHHVQPRIPMYNLLNAQSDLECAFGDEITREHLSLKLIREVYAKCKLYDYVTHTWTDFSGMKTTDRLFAQSDSNNDEEPRT